MLTVVCWQWRSERDYRPQYVNWLRRMVARHLHVPHRFVCITDEVDGFDAGIDLMPVPKAALAIADIRTLEAAGCSNFRRLWMFSREAAVLGERVLAMDVDNVVIADMTHLVRRTEPFVGWRPIVSWGNPERITTGLYLMTPGCHPEVWETFSADGARAAHEAGFRGSDQAWVSYKLGSTVALWSDDDGIRALTDYEGPVPPPGTCVVQFAGCVKPWDIAGRGWVDEAIAC